MIKTIVKRFYKEWKSFGLDDITIFRTPASLNISGSLPITSITNHHSITTNATLASLFPDQQSVCLMLDAHLPEKLPLNRSTCVYTFSQLFSVLMAPLALIVDLDSHQFIVRQSQILSGDTFFSTQQFLVAVQQLIPLLHKSIFYLHENCSAAEVENIVSHLHKKFYSEVV
ncbi:MAG: hypothetical protein OXD32_05280 [Endozoicomonadaceae bacterium]|nr:hypothetical protein [Endozoicomonadaceae bacterium]MCY4329767.1 hypothetical protein [Endozoicomonadaceae bacterium]